MSQAFSVEGNQVKRGGQVIDTCTSHSEAVRAAQDRADPGSSMALKPTAGVVIAFEFDDAAEFVSTVDVDQAMAADVAASANPDEVAELMRRTPDEVEQAHAETVRAKQVDSPFEHRGEKFPAGSWVVMPASAQAEAYTDEAFTDRYRALGSKAAKSKPNKKPAAGASKPAGDDSKATGDGS